MLPTEYSALDVGLHLDCETQHHVRGSGVSDRMRLVTAKNKIPTAAGIPMRTTGGVSSFSIATIEAVL